MGNMTAPEGQSRIFQVPSIDIKNLNVTKGGHFYKPDNQQN